MVVTGENKSYAVRLQGFPKGLTDLLQLGQIMSTLIKNTLACDTPCKEQTIRYPPFFPIFTNKNYSKGKGMFPTIIYHILMICEVQLINSQNLL